MEVDVKHGWMDVHLKVKTKMEGEVKVSTKIVQGPAVDKDSVQLNGLDSDDYDMELDRKNNLLYSSQLQILTDNFQV